MKFKYLILLVLLLTVGVLFFTNPDETAHKAFIKDRFIALADQKIDEELEKINDPNLKIWGNLGKNFLPALEDKFVDELVDTRVRRKNYYLFSTTQVLYNESWIPVGIGVYNKIYLFPKVEERLQEFNVKEEVFKLLK
ncbi:MAG: DUF4359 domain-containing protein [Flavobacteriaceae bacterium]|jgi:hypothetical protein|nr:DUF4359 domain-containing protein [Flavobacteriaceae bacterium]